VERPVIICFRDASEVATMVVMAAKWPGKCRRCGKPIQQGSPMDWEKGAGAVHVSPADCEWALPESALVLRGPCPEDPEARVLIGHLLLAHPWRSATSKRYEKLPHQYTLRQQWPNDDEFVWCVEYIRRVGYEKRFIGRVWTYYDLAGMQYWDCGGPVEKVGLLNRATCPA
jgi:hypothetical protein